MKTRRLSFLIGLLFLILIGHQTAFSADFLDWESAGKVLKRFGEESKIKNSREWIQWAEGELLIDRFRQSGSQTEEKREAAALAEWEKAEKEETKSSATAKFLFKDRWHGYEYLSLTYTNLDFKEQAFGIHFELIPASLTVDEVVRHYGRDGLEVVDQGRKKTYRYAIPPGDSLKKGHWRLLQNQMTENDELWVDFDLKDEKEVASVEVLTVKANPYRTPFTKNWKWDDE
jgi:hypothetical protein